jgi:hypothetical protein
MVEFNDHSLYGNVVGKSKNFEDRITLIIQFQQKYYSLMSIYISLGIVFRGRNTVELVYLRTNNESERTKVIGIAILRIFELV